MNKKILILAASPRKEGNSDILCGRFAVGATEAGHTVEKVYVHDCNIGFCMACDACKDTGKCIQKDDMEGIIEKMLESDIVVIATPVYFYSMNGQLKTLIDRCVPRYMDIKDKEFYFIATAAERIELIERTIEGLTGFTDCLPGAEIKGVIYGGGAWEKGDIERSEAMTEAYRMGRNS